MNHESISSYARSGDPGGLLNLAYQDDPNNPLGGITKVIFTIDKFLHVHVPNAALHWVGNKIKSIFDTVANTVVSAKQTLDDNTAQLSAASSTGDLEALGAVVYAGDPTNPLNGVMSGIFTVTKIIHYPIAAVHWVGNKIKAVFDSVVSAVVATKEDVETNVTTAASLAASGDLAGLADLTFEANPTNPIGGIAVGISNVAKIMNYPVALVKWVANKIKDKFDEIAGKVGTDREALETSQENMATNAASGEVSKVWEESYDTTEGNPLGGVFKGIHFISKLINTAMAVFHKVFDAVSDVVIKAKELLAHPLETIFQGIKDFIADDDTSTDDTSMGGPRSRRNVAARNRIAINRIGGPISSSPAISTGNGYGGNPLDKPAAITSTYGSREKPYKGNHRGIDITPANGDNNAAVSSRYSGVVSHVKRNVADSDTARSDKNGIYQYYGSNSAGNEVWIDTDDGLRVKAMHLKAGSIPSNIKPGSMVNPGTPIGSMGSTGWSTGPHLHYQIEKMTDNRTFVPVNPISEFMGGPVGKINVVLSKANRRGDDAQYTRWISIIKSVKQQIAAKQMGYSYGGNSIKITVDGFTRTYRTDCSGMVSHCLSAFAKKNIDVTSNSLLGNVSAVSDAGFTKYSWPGWDKLIPGDIISKSGHVEIFAGTVDGETKVWNCGSDESCNNPGATGSSYPSYSVVWRLNSAPATAGNVLADDYGSAVSSTSTSGSTSAPTVASTLTDLGNSFMSMITGGLINATSSSSSNDTSSSSSSTNVDWSSNDTAKTVYSYFTGNGYSPEAAAGILGNMYQESGVDPTKIQGNGKGPAAGIVQWENYNTKSARWKSMADYAASKGKDWTDLQSQLEYVDKELSSSGMTPFWNNIKSVEGRKTGASSYEDFKKLTDVTEATYQFEKTFERAGKPNMSRRLEAAKGYLNTYKTGGPIDDESMIVDVENAYSEEMNLPTGGPISQDLDNSLSKAFVLTDATDSNDIITKHKYANLANKPPMPSILNNRKSSSSVISMVDNFTSKSNADYSNAEKYDDITSNKPSYSRPSTVSIFDQNDTTTVNTTNQDMVDLKYRLDKIVSYLEAIVANTGLSSDLLGSINDKDFVDQGLRDSLNALSKVKKTNTPYRYGSTSSTTSTAIANMARP